MLDKGVSAERGRYHYVVGRNGGKELRTPEDKARCQEMYKIAHFASKASGTNYEVDHVFPISKGGLHISSNLQILTASANRIKYNTTDKENNEEPN